MSGAPAGWVWRTRRKPPAVGGYTVLLGDTTSGVWMGFKALAAITTGAPGHHVIRQASTFAKLIEGEFAGPAEHMEKRCWIRPATTHGAGRTSRTMARAGFESNRGPRLLGASYWQPASELLPGVLVVLLPGPTVKVGAQEEQVCDLLRGRVAPRCDPVNIHRDLIGGVPTAD
ncbi:hypothetical protein Ga0074812_15232 [Parafrankia irregularis]|uniref:Uncharacterized protein n=1 Tax=Parafrankia irregularis TaxID=795642 RepID=A0A0S4R0U4_9ACTN|nr:hypothetical protein Ga0074812_15232 [Parafrankia irregularis]